MNSFMGFRFFYIWFFLWVLKTLVFYRFFLDKVGFFFRGKYDRGEEKEDDSNFVVVKKKTQ